MTDMHIPEPDTDDTQVPPTSDGKAAAKEVTPFGTGKRGKKFENFWYHYKTHTIIAAILVVTVIICLVQCLTRPATADFHIFYFGPADLKPSSTNTIVADSQNALLPDAKEALGDEEATVQLSFYTINHANKDAIVQNANQQNRATLLSLLQAPSDGSGYIYLLGEVIYNDNSTYGRPLVEYMADLRIYKSENSPDTLHFTKDGTGVYIHSTRLASLPGIKDLPEDTILCLHTLTPFMEDDVFARCENLIRKILA